VEPEGSLLCSQEPATGPYPDPNASSLICVRVSDTVQLNEVASSRGMVGMIPDFFNDCLSQLRRLCSVE